MKPTDDELEWLRKYVAELYDYRCVRCQKPDVSTVHEIESRSTRPRDWWTIENMVCLCSLCHEWSHLLGVRNRAEALRKFQDQALRARGVS